MYGSHSLSVWMTNVNMNGHWVAGQIIGGWKCTLGGSVP